MSTGIGLLVVGAAAIAVGLLDYLILSDAGTASVGAGSGFFGLDGTSVYRITYVLGGILLMAVGAAKVLASIRARMQSTASDDH